MAAQSPRASIERGARERAEANKTRGSEDAMTSLTVRYRGSTECAGAAGRTDAPSHAVFHRLVNACVHRKICHFSWLHVDLYESGAPGDLAATRLFVTERTSKTSWVTKQRRMTNGE
jgi:hypothetical protein